MSGHGLDIAQAVVSLTLLAAVPWAMAIAYPAAASALIDKERSAQNYALAAALLCGALLRWVIVPLEPAMIFVGYKQTALAHDLIPLGHYGAGATALYHALFAVLPVDHRSIMLVNAAIGAATIPFVAAWSARVFRDVRVGIIVAWLVAFTPLLIRNDASEANHVPLLWWLFAGGVLLGEACRRWEWRRGLVAALMLALAGVVRPEAPALVVAVVAITLLAEKSRPPLAAIGGFCVLVAVLWIPHATHVWAMIDRLGVDSQGSLAIGPSHAEAALTRLNVLLKPTLVSPVLGLAALFGVIAAPKDRRLVAAAVAVAVGLALIVVSPDIDVGNIARVESPAVVFAVTLAGLGIVAVSGRVKGPAAVPVSVSIVVLVLVASIPSAGRLWAPTNEAVEDDLIRRTLHEIPPDATLIRLGVDERRGQHGDRRTHMHFPDYLFQPPGNPGQLASVRDFVVDPGFEDVFFFQGMRCFAEFRADEPQPEGENFHPACQRMHEQFVLEPVFAERVLNHGDPWISYYGSAETFDVGLYRVVGSRNRDQSEGGRND